MTAPAGNWHIGRSWEGHRLEDFCPCPKAPCGLAIVDPDQICPEHFPANPAAAKTIRQAHRPEDCPGPS